MSCPASPTASVRARIRRTSSRSSSLFEEINSGGDYRCVPGAQVFNPDGSVRAQYSALISTSFIMLPDGTSEKYNDYCQRCSSPLLPERIKLNVVFGEGVGKSVFPFQFKGLWIYPQLYYKTFVNGQWVTIAGSCLQPTTDDTNSLILYQKPNYPARIYELYPTQAQQTRSTNYPFYFKNISINRDSRYKIFVKDRFIVVFGAQLQPGPDANTLLLYQGPNNLTPITEIFTYDPNSHGVVQPVSSTQPTYSFIFKGLPIYAASHYKVFLDTRWQIVMGSQLRPSTDGSSVIFYKNPNYPVRIEQVILVNAPTVGSYPYPEPQSNYNPYYQQQSPSRYNRNQAPAPYSPRYNQQQSPCHKNYRPASPSKPNVSPTQNRPAQVYYNTTGDNYNPSSPTYHHVPNQPNLHQHQSSKNKPYFKTPSPIQKPAANCEHDPSPEPTEEPVRPYSPINNNVPHTSRQYPFLFKGVMIHADRCYQVKTGKVWEIVDGKQLHPAKNDPCSLIVNFANFNVAIVTDLFLYQPERYTPVKVTINGINIAPEQKYYVDLGQGGSLIVPGAKIQRHTSRNVGVIWHNETYYDIVKVKVIVNSNMSDPGQIEVLCDANVPVSDGETKKTPDRSCNISPICICTNVEPCNILPLECPKCSRACPGRITPPLTICSPVKAPPASPTKCGILRSPSRNQDSPRKTVTLVETSSPSNHTSSSSSSESEEIPRYFKDIQIYPDLLYSVLLENNTTKIVLGKLLRTKPNRKYVKVSIGNEKFKSYFVRPITPDVSDDNPTPKNPGFYRIYLNGKWQIIPANNVRLSSRRPGRYVVIYDTKKYIIKAVNVVPVIMADDQYPNVTDNTISEPSEYEHRLPSHPERESPVRPHPIPDHRGPSKSSRSRPAPDNITHWPGKVTPCPSWGGLQNSSSSDNTSTVHQAQPTIVPLSELYGADGKLKPQYESLISCNEPHVVIPLLNNKHTDACPRNSPIPLVVNGTLIFPDKHYIVVIDHASHAVLGKHFKPRKHIPGQYTVKVGDCRLLVPIIATITPQDPHPSPKNVSFQPVGRCEAPQCSSVKPELFSDTDSIDEAGYVVLVKGSWVRVGPKAVRSSKTQVGYAVVKHKDGVHLVLERDVRALQENEDIIRLECKLASGRRLMRTWFVKKLPHNCLDSIKDVSYESGEDPVFVLRNSGSRNINDKDIRRLTNCIRTHFESAQVIFEDDYLQLAEDGFGVKSPIWVNVRKNKRPQYYKLLDDLTDESYMDKSLSDNSYLDNLTITQADSSNHGQYGRGSQASRYSAVSQCKTYRSSSAASTNHSSTDRKKSRIFNKLNSRCS